MEAFISEAIDYLAESIAQLTSNEREALLVDSLLPSALLPDVLHKRLVHLTYISHPLPKYSLRDSLRFLAKHYPIAQVHSTTVVMAATSFHCFKDLPTELRAHIIRHCLPNQRTITARTHINAYGYAVVNLRLVSKDVCALVAQVYYNENTFLVTRSRIMGGDYESKVHVPHRGISPHIRKLDLRIEFRGSIKTHLDLCGYDVYINGDEADQTRWTSTPSALLNLIRPNSCVETPSSLNFPPIGPKTVLLLDERATYSHRSLAEVPPPEHRNRLTHWQKDFVGLVKLKITIAATSCLDAGARKMLKDLVRSTRTFLHPKELEIVVLVDGCEEATARLDMAGNAGCDGRCTHIVHGIFSELMGWAAKRSSSRRRKAV